MNCFYDRKLFLRHIRKKKYNTITGHSHRRHRNENTHFGTDKVHTSRSHRESHRTVWTNMDSHGIVWIRVGSFGAAWIRLISNGFKLIRMDSSGFAWIRMGFNAKLGATGCLNLQIRAKISTKPPSRRPASKMTSQTINRAHNRCRGCHQASPSQLPVNSQSVLTGS